MIAALCLTVTPLVALKGQEIMKEGSVGQEMYMIMTGGGGSLGHSATRFPL